MTSRESRVTSRESRVRSRDSRVRSRESRVRSRDSSCASLCPELADSMKEVGRGHSFPVSRCRLDACEVQEVAIAPLGVVPAGGHVYTFILNTLIFKR